MATSREQLKRPARYGGAAERIFWRRWNLLYTKDVLASDPYSAMAQALLRCWPARIQQALSARYVKSSAT